MGRPRLHYLKQEARNTGAVGYTAVISDGKLSTNQRIERLKKTTKAPCIKFNRTFQTTGAHVVKTLENTACFLKPRS
jgi:hypothetical protein